MRHLGFTIFLKSEERTEINVVKPECLRNIQIREFLQFDKANWLSTIPARIVEGTTKQLSFNVYVYFATHFLVSY